MASACYADDQARSSEGETSSEGTGGTGSTGLVLAAVELHPLAVAFPLDRRSSLDNHPTVPRAYLCAACRKAAGSAPWSRRPLQARDASPLSPVLPASPVDLAAGARSVNSTAPRSCRKTPQLPGPCKRTNPRHPAAKHRVI